MTRREDDKRGGPDSELSQHGQKVERRSTKTQRAHTTQAGQVDGRKVSRDNADNTGGRGHNDLVADI